MMDVGFQRRRQWKKLEAQSSTASVIEQKK
jgi:hypothetical protein